MMDKTIKKMIEVMEGFGRGEEIEITTSDNGNWFACTDPAWNWEVFDYRIKINIIGHVDRKWCGRGVGYRDVNNVYGVVLGIDETNDLIMTSLDNFKWLDMQTFFTDYYWLNQVGGE